MSVDCRWTRPRIPAHVDAELDAADAESVAAHLASCPECSSFARVETALKSRLVALASTENAPTSLRDRIRQGLDRPAAGEDSQPTPAAPDTPKQRASISRSGRAWGLALAAAAAALILAVLPWEGSGSRLVSAMASEHAEHVTGQDYHDMEVVSEADSDLELYLSRELGTTVVLPPDNIPPRKAAHCCEHNGVKMGIVGCFCARRGKAVTVFVVRSDGIDLAGLEVVTQDGGMRFYRGASRSCRVVIWARGKLHYALAGELDEDDILDMACRASAALSRKTDA